jgi:two-component system response regulator BaeR
MSDAATILIVEDEEKLARLVGDYLGAAGYRHHWLAEGTGVADWVREHRPDLVLLDLMLPGRDGLDICRDIRSFSQVPIIMVTARVEEIDRLLGLELGADDYICKPFSPRELVARIKAVLRRLQAPAPTDSGLLILEPHSHRVRAGDAVVELTTVEYRLFETLYLAPGRIFSRDQLMDRAYDDGRIVSDRTIDSHVKKLRRKLGELLPAQELVHSVYGAGYRYEPMPGGGH